MENMPFGMDLSKTNVSMTFSNFWQGTEQIFHNKCFGLLGPHPPNLISDVSNRSYKPCIMTLSFGLPHPPSPAKALVSIHLHLTSKHKHFFNPFWNYISILQIWTIIKKLIACVIPFVYFIVRFLPFAV